MGELSRMMPRRGGILLLGLAVGLLWCAISILVHHTVAFADEEEPPQDGLLGVVTRAVPAQIGVTEVAESAVRATTAVLTDSVAELPRLGHLPVVTEAVAAADDVAPIVDAIVGEDMLEPVLDAVLGPVLDLPGLDVPGGAPVGPAATSGPAPPTDAALTVRAPVPTTTSGIGSPRTPIVSEEVPAVPSHAPGGHALLPSAGVATSSAPTASGSAADAALSAWGVELHVTRASSHDDAAPPGPAARLDTTPD